jgi:hypothetical protein
MDLAQAEVEIGHTRATMDAIAGVVQKWPVLGNTDNTDPAAR